MAVLCHQLSLYTSNHPATWPSSTTSSLCTSNHYPSNMAILYHQLSLSAPLTTQQHGHPLPPALSLHTSNHYPSNMVILYHQLPIYTSNHPATWPSSATSSLSLYTSNHYPSNMGVLCYRLASSADSSCIFILGKVHTLGANDGVLSLCP